MVALGPDHGVEVGARYVDGEQREVVVAVHLDVELGPLRQIAFCGRIGEAATQLAQLQGLADDFVVTLRRVHLALVPVVQLQVEERRRLPPPRFSPAASLATDAGIQPSRKPVSCAPSSMFAFWL